MCGPGNVVDRRSSARDSGFPRASSWWIEFESEDSEEKDQDERQRDQEDNIVIDKMAEHSDRQAAAVVTLSKDNYDRWLIEVKDALQGQRLWRFVEGKEVKPEEPNAEDGDFANKLKHYEDFVAADARAKGLIRRTLDATTFSHVRDCETSKAVMDRIRELREPKSVNDLMAGISDFLDLDWKEDDDVTSFLASLSLIKSRVNAVNDANVKLTDGWMVMKTLKSLPPGFASFVQSWNLTTDDKSTFESFRKQLLNAERIVRADTGSEQRSGNQVPPGDSFAVHAKDTGRGKKKKFAGKCFTCGHVGHKADMCPNSGTGERKEQRKGKGKGNSLMAGLAFTAFASQDLSHGIIADSGASRDLTANGHWFTSMHKLDVPLSFVTPNGQELHATHEGTIACDITADGKKWTPALWEDVLFVPGMGHLSLMSTTYRERKGFEFGHKNGKMFLKRGGKVVIGGERIPNHTSYMPFIRVKPPAAALVAVSVPLSVWHARLGHVPDRIIKVMNDKELVAGLKLSSLKRNPCDACHLGRQTISRHPAVDQRRRCKPGERFHTDVCHINVKSWDGHLYFMTFKDEASCYRIVYFLKSKDQVAASVKHWLQEAAKQTGRNVLSLRTDNGTEYVNASVTQVLLDLGVTHEKSPPYVKQANGMAERENRTLCDTARSLLYHADLSDNERKLLWCEAVAFSAFVRNRVPNRGKNYVTPYEEWFEKKPDLSNIRTFGSTAFVRIPDEQRKKLDPKSRKGVFVGPDYLSDKVYRVFDRLKRKVDRVSDVKIVEQGLSVTAPNFEESTLCESATGNHIFPYHADQNTVDAEEDGIHTDGNSAADSEKESLDSEYEEKEEVDHFPSDHEEEDEFYSGGEDHDADGDDLSDNELSLTRSGSTERQSNENASLRRFEQSDKNVTKRRFEQSDESEDFQHFGFDSNPFVEQDAESDADMSVTEDVTQNRNVHQVKGLKRKTYTPHQMMTRSKRLALLVKELSRDPISVTDALSRPDADLWQAAMDDEMNSHAENGTWKLQQMDEGRKAITCKWVFKVKLNPDGSILKRKARLVARGFSQVSGVDYFETFSPVVRYESVRCILALAASLDMEMVQFDVKTAFLNGSLNEVIFMNQPEGYEDGTERKCRLMRSLYGLKQASRNWNKEFVSFLTTMGFIATEEDACVYVKKDKKDVTIVCLYVDDGLVRSTSKSLVTSFMISLKKRFSVTAHEPKVYVGMELKRDRKNRTIAMNQQGYIRTVVDRFGLRDASTVTTPLEANVKLEPVDGDVDKECPYREAVGCLNYLSLIIRPDITFAVNSLARYSAAPKVKHWTAVKRVVRYLKGTSDLSIHYGGQTKITLTGYSDADWAGEQKERKSTSGFLFMLNNGPVAWLSRLQRLTATSTLESEYIALMEALKECLWLRPFLSSLGIENDGPTVIYEDN